MNKSLGQIAYEAYCDKTGWKSLATGADLPKWDKLNVDIRDAWEAAARQVAQHERSRMTARFIANAHFCNYDGNPHENIAARLAERDRIFEEQLRMRGIEPW